MKIEQLNKLKGIDKSLKKRELSEEYWVKEENFIKELKLKNDITKESIRMSEFDFKNKFFK
jgi:hypothetical protein